jgi:hypothetical protein
MTMTRSILLISAVLSGTVLQAQSILETIPTPDKAVATVNQSLEATWMMEIHVPGAPLTQLPVQNLVTFHPDGTVVASAGDGMQGTAHGVWVRVGDRRFLQTMFVFNFDANRAVTTILKVRINVLVSLDGHTLKGTTEVAVITPGRGRAGDDSGRDILRSSAQPRDSGRLLRFPEDPVAYQRTGGSQPDTQIFPRRNGFRSPSVPPRI